MAEPAGMSAERIVEAARELVEAGGIDQLSMRKLAAELGVAPTAIYWHVGGREELLGRALDLLLAEQAPLQVEGVTPRARIRSAALAIRQQVTDAPLPMELAMMLGRNAEVALPGQIALAREVSAAGLTGNDAAGTVRALLFLVGGHVLLEHTYRQRRPADAVDAHQLWLGVEDAEIDPELREALGRPTDPDQVLEFALDRMLDGVLPAPEPPA